MFDRPHRLHPAAIIINIGVYFVRTSKAMAAPLIAALASGGRSGGHFRLLLFEILVALIGVLSIAGPVLHYLSTRFYIESDALVISSGFVWRKRRIIPLARIQNVNLERTIWHRLLGAASVKVETASGHKGEGDLDALSVADADKLQTVLLQRRGIEAPPAEAVQPAPLYALSLKQVLLAGMLGNRLVYIVAGVISVFQFDRSANVFRPLIQLMQRLSPVAAVLAASLAFFTLVAVGWIVSIVMSATRFYGFRIDRHERGLLLSHGLITQFRAIVPVGRIQTVRIVEPILFRLNGYCELYADTAGAYDKKDVGSANKICPILPERDISQIGRHLLPDFEFENLSWRRVSQKTVARRAFRYFFQIAILMAWPLGNWMKYNALWLLIPLAIYCWLMGLVHYGYVGYSFTQDLLVSRSGVFRRRATIIPFDRIQYYAITSTFFQRVQGIASVTVVSAAQGGHPIHIEDIDHATAESLRQTIGASISSHLGARRGGL